MGKYVERNLYENEVIVEKADRDAWGLFGWWVLAVFFFWVLFVPLITAIVKTVQFKHTELILTNKRIIRKTGVFQKRVFDAPLHKIQSVYVIAGFWNRVFNIASIRIITMNGIIIDRIADADDFKTTILGQLDMFQSDNMSRQAEWTAKALYRLNKQEARAKQQQMNKKYPAGYPGANNATQYPDQNAGYPFFGQGYPNPYNQAQQPNEDDAPYERKYKKKK